MFKPVTLPTIHRVSENGTRYYVTPDGNKYPSVTSIFSILKNESIDKWRQAVGEEEASRVSKRAATRGTWIHSQCESLIKGQEVQSSILYDSDWNAFRPLVEQIGDVYALESQMYSDQLRVAGTVDCIGYWNNVLSVIDFKTSKRRKKHEDISSYWMQTAAYSCMFYELTGIRVTQLVILMMVEDDQPIVFVDSTKNWIKPFINLRKQYDALRT